MGVIFGWLRRPKLAKKLRFYVARKKSGRRYATIAVKLLSIIEQFQERIFMGQPRQRKKRYSADDDIDEEERTKEVVIPS